MKHSLSLSLLLVGATCAFGDTLYVSPASLNGTVGHTFSVDIYVDDIPHLYAYQFALSFNPTVLAADSITEGALFANTNNSFFLPGIVNNTAGTIGVTADTLLSGSGVNGPGIVAIANFTALRGGTSPLTLSNAMLLNPSLNPIAFAAGSGTANVAAAEPATICLLATALALTIFGKWRRRPKQGAIATKRVQRQLKGGVQAFNFGFWPFRPRTKMMLGEDVTTG